MLAIEQEFADSIESIDDPAEMITTVFDGVERRPSYPRLLSWLLLEGVDPTDHIDDYPMVARLRQAIEPHVGAAAAGGRTQALLAFIAGWSTTHEFMADCVGLEPGQRRRATDRAREEAVRIGLGTSA